MVNIAGISKGKVLKALYDNSRPLGLGFLQAKPGPMSLEQAENIAAEMSYFDYLQGRVMKVDISGDEFHPGGYDRDNGEGAAQRAIDSISAESFEKISGVNMKISKEEFDKLETKCTVEIPGFAEAIVFKEFIALGFDTTDVDGGIQKKVQLLGATDYEGQMSAITAIATSLVESIKSLEPMEQFKANISFMRMIEKFGKIINTLDE